MNEVVPRAVQDCHDLLRWLIPHLDKFPRARRFTLGERLETALLDVLAELTDAAYRVWPHRRRLRHDNGHRFARRLRGYAAAVSGCAKARINGEQRSPLPAICGAGGDSERWVGV